VIKFAFDVPLRRCALGLTNGDVVIRSLADGSELVQLRQQDGGIPAAQDGAAGLEFSADGRRLSVRYLGGAFAIWDIDARRVVLSRDADQRRRLASDARFTSDARHVVAPVFAPRDGGRSAEVIAGERANWQLSVRSSVRGRPECCRPVGEPCPIRKGWCKCGC